MKELDRIRVSAVLAADADLQVRLSAPAQRDTALDQGPDPGPVQGLERVPLQDAAVETVHDGQPHSAYGVEFQIEDGWLTTRLPSGRKLWYYDPRPVLVSVPWDDAILKRSYSYSAQKTGRWIRVKAYGGIITENVVQALARDLMVHAMFICEREHMPIVLTVHDEIVCEVDDNGQDWAKMLQQIMEDQPQWAIDMQVPVTAECWQGTRYHK